MIIGWKTGIISGFTPILGFINITSIRKNFVKHTQVKLKLVHLGKSELIRLKSEGDQTLRLLSPSPLCGRHRTLRHHTHRHLCPGWIKLATVFNMEKFKKHKVTTTYLIEQKIRLIFNCLLNTKASMYEVLSNIKLVSLSLTTKSFIKTHQNFLPHKKKKSALESAQSMIGFDLQHRTWPILDTP